MLTITEIMQVLNQIILSFEDYLLLAFSFMLAFSAIFGVKKIFLENW